MLYNASTINIVKQGTLIEHFYGPVISLSAKLIIKKVCTHNMIINSTVIGFNRLSVVTHFELVQIRK